MEQHTKGPWRVGDAGATVFGPKTDNPAPKTIAYVTRAMPSAEQKANARLIASAPALLAALDTIANGLEYYLDDGSNISKTVLPLEAVEIARAAIALAKGESR